MKLHWKIDNIDQLNDVKHILGLIQKKFFMHSLRIKPNNNGSYDVYLKPKKVALLCDLCYNNSTSTA